VIIASTETIESARLRSEPAHLHGFFEVQTSRRLVLQLEIGAYSPFVPAPDLSGALWFKKAVDQEPFFAMHCESVSRPESFIVAMHCEDPPATISVALALTQSVYPFIRFAERSLARRSGWS
jgi:hypothetical protein